MTRINNSSINRNIPINKINEYLLNNETFNIYFNKLDDNTESYNINIDTITSLIDLDFNLDFKIQI